MFVINASQTGCVVCRMLVLEFMYNNDYLAPELRQVKVLPVKFTAAPIHLVKMFKTFKRICAHISKNIGMNQ